MGGTVFDPRVYRPSGPTVQRFHESTAFTRLMAGPIGSAKTTAAFVAEPFFTAMTQKPNNQGVREAKVGVLRDTYRNLYATLIPTWHQWVPRDFGKFTGSDDRPASHDLEFMAPFTDGTPGLGLCRLRVEMRALGANTVEAVCRGWELHGAGVDEADLVPIEAFSFLGGRVMRGGRTEFRVSRGVWGTFNKPDTDHPLYTKCVEEAEHHIRDDFEFFDQPPGLLPGGPPFVVNPNAENIQNLDPNYYTRAAAGQPSWYVRRMIRNQWGASISGEPIFPEANLDLLFSAEELEPAPGAELFLGLDGGGTPACAVKGVTPSGRRVTYAEIVITDPSDPRGRKLMHGVGPKRFAGAIRDLLNSRFSRQRVTIGHGDPAAFFGADREMGEYSFMETVSQHLDIPIMPAPSNELQLRFEASRSLMLTLNPIDQRPQKIINPSCRFLRRGYGGDYKWEAADPKQPAKRLKPQKSASSHIMEADQYGDLGSVGRAALTSGKRALDQHRPKSGAGTPDGWQQSEGGVWAPAGARGSSSGFGQTGGQQSYKSDWSPWG